MHNVFPHTCFLSMPTYVATSYILPNQILQVSWDPADDVHRSNVSYIVNSSTTVTEFSNSTLLKHPAIMLTLTGVPQYSTGAVSVQAMNPGAVSVPVRVGFRMLNIVTNGRNFKQEF